MLMRDDEQSRSASTGRDVPISLGKIPRMVRCGPILVKLANATRSQSRAGSVTLNQVEPNHPTV